MAQDKKVESTAFRILLSSMLKHDVKEISVDSLKELPLENVYLLDARKKEEFEVSHLPNARWVGYDEFDLKAIKDIPKDKTLVVYCSIGARSESITRKLKEAGYPNAYNLYGGLFEWYNRGNKGVKNGEETDSIHGYSKVWSIWVKNGQVVY